MITPPPHTRITRKNFSLEYDNIMNAILEASIIAIDCEFSGLGHGLKDAKSQNMDKRYQCMAAVAKSHSLISIGLTILKSSSSLPSLREASSRNFEILTLCQSSFAMSASSMEFLATNGFDLNEYAKEGIPYIPFSDSQSNEKTMHYDTKECTRKLQDIFMGILQISSTKSTPVIIHNGLFDLIYLYQSFYADLPAKLNTFISDLYEMFPGGLFDTKYISCYSIRETTNFLSYLYRKYQMMMIMEDERRVIEIDTPVEDMAFCNSFRYHGHCSKENCIESHDLDLIIKCDILLANGRVPSKRRKKQVDMTAADTSASISNSMNDARSGIPHTAYFDAYMTAFVFIYQKFLLEQQEGIEDDSSNAWRNEWQNRLYLMGKQIPLLIAKSRYESTSKSHKLRMQQLLKVV